MSGKDGRERVYWDSIPLLAGQGKEPGETDEKGGGHLTMSKAGFVPGTWLVNGVPFNQEATRENLYTVGPIYNRTPPLTPEWGNIDLVRKKHEA